MKINMPEPVKQIISRLSASGYEAYAVGGCIRDSITGAVPNDWDICTSALPEQVEAVFSDMHIIETGLQHGTVTLMINHVGYEITTYRTEGTYSDRRKPDYVSFVTDLREDVNRRDFTINAMAYNDENGLRDYFGGTEDLKARIIRCVGTADERFNEDALRILRAMRFAAAFDFEIEEKTALAMHRNRELLSYVSMERIAVELLKLLKGSGAARILREFSDILAVVIPEITPCIGFEQHSKWHCYDVWEHTLHAIDAAEPGELIRLTMLLHDIGKPECYTYTDGEGHFYDHANASERIAKTVLKRLKLSNEIIGTVCALVKHHDAYGQIGEKGIKRLLNRIGMKNARRLLMVTYADMCGQAPEKRMLKEEKLEYVRTVLDKIEENNECVNVKSLAVNGRDMISLGLKGREIGDALNLALNAVIDEKVKNEKTALMEYLTNTELRKH
ncbi:MAG: HD domain-containing protein [bacterium]|nr:HD domain-containing protein [bacterium]